MIEMHSNKQKKKKNYLMFVTEVEEGLIEMGFPYRKIKQAQSGLTKKKQSWVVDYWIKEIFSDESGLVEKVMLELLPEENKQISPLIHGMGLEDRWRTRGGGSNSNWTGVCSDLGLFSFRDERFW